MCGRYTVAVDLDDLARELSAELPDAPLAPRWNVAPTQDAPVIVGGAPRRVALHRWGLLPPWSKDLRVGARAINARAETAATRPTFRDAWRHRRCLVPADGFYEWRREGERKTPFHVRTRGGVAATFAGLWERWKSPDGVWVRSFAILTVPALGGVAAIHDRMPALVAPGHREAWIDPGLDDARAVAALLGDDDVRLDLLDGFEIVEVSPAVGSPAHDGPELVEPVGGPPPGPILRG